MTKLSYAALVLGLKAELSALKGKQEPLENIILTMRKTLEATKNLLVSKQEPHLSKTEIDIKRVTQVRNQDLEVLFSMSFVACPIL